MSESRTNCERIHMGDNLNNEMSKNYIHTPACNFIPINCYQFNYDKNNISTILHVHCHVYIALYNLHLDSIYFSEKQVSRGKLSKDKATYELPHMELKGTNLSPLNFLNNISRDCTFIASTTIPYSPNSCVLYIIATCIAPPNIKSYKAITREDIVENYIMDPSHIHYGHLYGILNNEKHKLKDIDINKNIVRYLYYNYPYTTPIHNIKSFIDKRVDIISLIPDLRRMYNIESGTFAELENADKKHLNKYLNEYLNKYLTDTIKQMQSSIKNIKCSPPNEHELMQYHNILIDCITEIIYPIETFCKNIEKHNVFEYYINSDNHRFIQLLQRFFMLSNTDVSMSDLQNNIEYYRYNFQNNFIDFLYLMNGIINK